MLSQIAYAIPGSVDEAVKLMADSGARVLAGGTDLVIQIREKEVSPGMLVDLGHIEALQGIRVEDNVLIIGALTPFSRIAESPLVLEHAPALAAAAGSVGSPQIRNTATIGGNVVNGAVAADSVPTLMALDAQLSLVSAGMTRKVPVESFMKGLNQTDIAPGEILTEIEIPLKESRQMVFEKIGRRQALAIARINIAVVLTSSRDSGVEDAAIALGAVGTTAYRVDAVEEFLIGKQLTPDVISEAQEKIRALVKEKLGSRPTAAYKSEIAGAVLGRALRRIVNPEGGDCIE